MPECYLHGHGPCGGGFTGEHYVSETVLEAIDGSGTSKIGGLPWQEEGTLKVFGNAALVSNILCSKHNSSLSPLDTVAGSLFRAVDAADKCPSTLPAVSTFDGLSVERWFLKVICGLSAGVGFNGGIVPDLWKQILRGQLWPEGWGLYVPNLGDEIVLAKEFSLETLVNPPTKAVLALKIRIAGVPFSLLLGKPDYPQSWGIFRPRGLVFCSPSLERRIEFTWPNITDEVIFYRKMGTSNKQPPQHKGWKG
jgi:hypothetical protein